MSWQILSAPVRPPRLPPKPFWLPDCLRMASMLVTKKLNGIPPGLPPASAGAAPSRGRCRRWNRRRRRCPRSRRRRRPKCHRCRRRRRRHCRPSRRCRRRHWSHPRRRCRRSRRPRSRRCRSHLTRCRPCRCCPRCHRPTGCPPVPPRPPVDGRRTGPALAALAGGGLGRRDAGASKQRPQGGGENRGTVTHPESSWLRSPPCTPVDGAYQQRKWLAVTAKPHFRYV